MTFGTWDIQDMVFKFTPVASGWLANDVSNVSDVSVVVDDVSAYSDSFDEVPGGAGRVAQDGASKLPV